MKKYIYIGIGGAFGSISRYALGNVNIWSYKDGIPFNTLLVNISGSLLLAFIVTAGIIVWKLDENVRQGIEVGFLGAYTTFSTLCSEAGRLLLHYFYFEAVAYMLLSVLLGLGAAFLGAFLAERLLGRKKRTEDCSLIQKNTSDSAKKGE